MIWDTQLTNCNVMFADLKNIVKIDLTKFDFSKVKGMAGMFSNCNGLTSIKFGNLSNYKFNSKLNLNIDAFSMNSQKNNNNSSK